MMETIITNSPTRFEPDVGFVTGAPEMYVNTAGSYIKFEDYEQLKQRLDAVIAECAVVKSLNSKLCDELSGYETDNEDFGPAPQSLALAYSTETPNITAALAEVEAKAFEKAAKEIFGCGYFFELLMRHAKVLREGRA